MAINFDIASVVKSPSEATYKGVDLSEININGKLLLFQPLKFNLIEGGTTYEVSLKEGVNATGLDIVIPETFNGISVTKIAGYGFANSDIKSVYFGEHIDTIGDYAFMGCSSLERVGIKSSYYDCVLFVESIGVYAFQGCALETIFLNTNVDKIGSDAFNSLRLKYIFYAGTASKWNNDVDNNDASVTGKLCVYSNEKPGAAANVLCWHYDEETGSPVLWEDVCHSKGHVYYEESYTAPTCETPGVKVEKCIGCGFIKEEILQSTGHTWSDWNVELEPSCIEGLQRRVCATCGGVEEEVIPAKGNHVWAIDLCTEPKICANCGYVDPYHTVQSGHYMELILTHEPYCDVGGLQVFKCRHCSYQKLVDLLALNHDWDDWYPTIYPTGITEGTKRRECKRCSKIETAPIPKIETADEYFDYTLLEDGTYSVKPLPDISLPAELVIPSEYEGIPVTQIEKEAFEGCNEYSPGRNIISVYIPSSIKHIGAYAFQECYGIEEVIIPSSVEYIGRQAFYDCGATIYCEAASQPDGWHSEWSDSDDPNTVEWDYHNDPENWEDEGLYAGSYLITVEETATNMTVSSSCGSIAAGAVNGWTHAAAIKIPLNVQNIQPKAFTDCKNLTIYCEAESKPEGWLDGWCDDSVTIVWGFTGCVEHSWSDWEITIDSTCVENGERKRTCAKCGEVEVEIINASHDWDSEVEVVPPTCTDGGYTIHRCNNCAETYWDNLTDPLGHTPSDWIIDVEATAETDGSKHKECTRCGVVLETAVIPKLEETDKYILTESGEFLTDEEGNKLIIEGE